MGEVMSRPDTRLEDRLRIVPEELRDRPFYIAQAVADDLGDLSASQAIAKYLKLKQPDSGKLYRLASEGQLGVVLEADRDGENFLTLRSYARFTIAVGDAKRAKRDESSRKLREAAAEKLAIKPRKLPASRSSAVAATSDADEATLAEFGIGQKNAARPKTDRAARDDNSATTKSKESTHA
jgi:hypothetical protein